VGVPENTTPADRLLELFVFAPAGLALTFVEELPNLVEKGRNRIEGRTATARVVGQFAVQMGFREVTKRARQLVDGGQPQRRQSASRVPKSDVDSTTSSDVDRAREQWRRQPADLPDLPLRIPVPEEYEAGDHEAGERAELNGFAALGDLAIPAYDSLSASQVVKRLDGLSRAELLEVGDHERQNRHRATILAKVEQLLLGETSAGA
jgi:hypothetical protein